MMNRQIGLAGFVFGALALNGCIGEKEKPRQYKQNPIIYVTTVQKVEINLIYESSGACSKWKVNGISVRKTEFEGSEHGIIQEKIYNASDPEFRILKELLRIEQER